MAVKAITSEPADEKPDSSDTQLLSFLDTLFEPLLEGSRANVPEVNTAESFDPQQQMEADRAADAARDLAALEAFLNEGGASAALPSMMEGCAPNMDGKPRVGLGPRLYIGFDAEWVAAGPGRNLILSIQMVVYGPSGERYDKLFDLTEDGEIGRRPTLADALDVVLDEAEQEGVFEHWPCEIVLVGFFLRGDLTAFADFKALCHQLDGIGGTLGTVGSPATVQLAMNEQRLARLKTHYQRVLGDAFDPRMLKVRILDACGLAPPGTSLAKVGQWLDEPKIELPTGYDKSDMRRFKRREPEKFKAYALHDANLAVLYALWVLWFSDRHMGLKGLSATVSGLAVRMAELCMRKDGVHPDVALNFDLAKQTSWSSRRGRLQTSTERVPTDIRRWLEPFLADVFQGGRNEAYVFGPSERDDWYDSDLAGAYVTGLSVFMTLDYTRARMAGQVSEYTGGVAGFAKVRFRFPAGTRFPCLPVQVETGLWFPLEGESLCTSFEIELAQNMGAELDIEFGVVIPWKTRSRVFADSAERLRKASKQRQKVALDTASDEPGSDQEVCMGDPGLTFPPPDHGDEGYRPMESFAITVRQQRLKYKRKTLPFEFMKLVGNGLYGKTGQGFKGKRSFGPKVMDSIPIGPSRVSEPAIAGLVCGFVRATLGEVLWKLPPDAKVLSLTTDGALMNVPTGQLDLSGSICRRYQALVDRVAPGTPMIELKHRVRQVFVPRTRGCFTIEAYTDALGNVQPQMCAKAGHKVVLDGDAEQQARLRTPEGESDWMIRLALDRVPGQALPQESLFSMRDMLVNGWDLQTQTRSVKVSLEYDFKRRPENVRMVRVEGYGAEHLAFDTVPWKSAAEGETVRTLFRQWRLENNLKTMADWHSWQAFLNHHQGNQRRRDRLLDAQSPGGVDGARPLRGGTGQMHLRGGVDGIVRLVVRSFLAAFTQGQWGLGDAKAGWTYKTLAQWLTEQGYKTSEVDVKNAKRSQLNEAVAADTPDVRQLLVLMKERFPNLEVERFIACA